MGVAFSHPKAPREYPSWSYSGFNDFRIKLWKHLGHSEDEWREHPSTDDIAAIVGDHPLRPLLAHSDCDGELTPDECRIVAPALRSALESLRKEGVAEWYDVMMGTRLADGMDEAAAANEPLIFR